MAIRNRSSGPPKPRTSLPRSHVPGKLWRGWADKCRTDWHTTLGIRYRKPYAARHTSVSWNLMIGKSPLYNAKQHGHSVATMSRVYSAWMDGAVEADIEAVRCAMQCARAPRLPQLSGRPWGHLIEFALQWARTVVWNAHSY